MTIITAIASLCLTSPLLAADQPTVADLIKILEDPAAKVEAKRDACAKLCQMETAAKDATGAVIRLAISDDARLRAAGVETLGWIAEDVERVAPILVRRFKDGEEAIRDKAVGALLRMGLGGIPFLIEAAKDESELVRENAIFALDLLGGEALSAAPTLLAALDDESEKLRKRAGRALESIKPPDPATVKAIIAKIEAPDATLETQIALVNVLGSYKNYSVVAVPTLTKLLDSKDAKLRVAGAWALVYIKPGAKEIPPILHDGLKSVPADHRVSILQALVDLGEDAEKMLPILLAAFDQTKDLQEKAEILRLVRTLGAPAVPEFIKLLKNPDFPYRDSILRELSAMGRDGVEAVPTLLAMTNEKDPNLVTQVLSTLASVADPTKEVLEALSESLKHKSPLVRSTAALAIGSFGFKSQPMQEALVACLTDKDPGVQSSALGALGAIGRTARDCAKELQSYMNGATDKLKLLAAAAIARIDPKHADARQVILAALTDDSSEVRTNALGLVARLRADGASFSEEVIGRLKDGDPGVRAEAAQCLWWIGVDESAAKELASALGDSSGEVRGMAAFSLARTPPAARATVMPLLRKTLTDRYGDVRIKAAISLCTLDPESKEGRDKLRACWPRIGNSIQESSLIRQREEIREMAVYAIDALGLAGPDARSTVRSLTRIARRAQDPAVREAAEKALKKIQPEK